VTSVNLYLLFLSYDNDDMGANVNSVSLVASLLIASGAIVMIVNIGKFKGILKILKQFAVEEYKESNWLFSLHQILIMFFLVGYIVVLYSTIMRIQIIGELFVGIIFFLGAIFVLFGILLQSRMMIAIKDNYLEVMAVGESLERERHQLVKVNEQLQQEINERKRADEALHLAHQDLAQKAATLEEVNEELSQYIQIASHDLKSPLRAIHNYADFLGEELGDSLDGNQKGYLDGLRSAVRQSEELGDDLLELSEVGRRSLSTQAIDMGMFFRQLIASFYLPEDVEVVIGDAWPTVYSEPALVGQIFNHLLSNAIKFNHSPRKRVEIDWLQTSDGRYELFVRDNGIGIDPRHHEKIFGAFHRLHAPADFTGSGIGLAIVKKATTKLNGSVRVESELGKGSTFFIVLPKSQKEG
jgi:signal transduction histidine kinase